MACLGSDDFTQLSLGAGVSLQHGSSWSDQDDFSCDDSCRTPQKEESLSSLHDSTKEGGPMGYLLACCKCLPRYANKFKTIETGTR